MNTAWRKRLQLTPYHAMMGLEPRTAFAALIQMNHQGFQFGPVDENRLQQIAVTQVDTEKKILAGVLQRVDADRCCHRARVAAINDWQLRSCGLSTPAGQAPRAHEHLGRTAACCHRRRKENV